MCDVDAEIKIVAFNEEVDRFYDQMNLNRVIYFFNKEIVFAAFNLENNNSQWSSTKST